MKKKAFIRPIINISAQQKKKKIPKTEKKKKFSFLQHTSNRHGEYTRLQRGYMSPAFLPVSGSCPFFAVQLLRRPSPRYQTVPFGSTDPGAVLVLSYFADTADSEYYASNQMNAFPKRGLYHTSIESRDLV